MYTCLYPSGRGSTWLYRPFSVCRPCARTSTPLDVDPRACTGPYRCVGPVHVLLPLDVDPRFCTGPFGVYSLCTYPYAPGRGSTCLYRPFSVRRTGTRAFIPVDVYPCGCIGPFRCVGPVHKLLRLWKWIHLSVPALFGVLALCTCLYPSGCGSTWLYHHFSLCRPCARALTPLDVEPRACIDPFRCVGPVHVPLYL